MPIIARAYASELDRSGQWLYQQILQEDNVRNPIWSLKGLTNWMKALDIEIRGEHGTTPAEQFESCRKHFSGITQRQGEVKLAPVFEPLYAALNFSMALTSMSQENRPVPWILPSAIVTWYYCFYNALRAVFTAQGIDAIDTHAWLYKRGMNSDLREKLPHPLNMVASWVRNEEYSLLLPDYPRDSNINLNRNFDGSREMARGMLLSYLKGTADFYAGQTKEQLKKQHKFDSFRTNEAKAARDKAIEKTINFGYCAFRYRGKANYRDFIYLSYAPEEEVLNGFMNALSSSSQFAFVLALAFVERRLGSKTVRQFLDDVRQHMHGLDESVEEEKFWMRLLA